MSQGKRIPDSVWDKFLGLLEENLGVITLACQAAGISRRSYYQKLLNDPNFSDKTQLLFERIQVPIAEEMLRADVLERKAWAIRYTLDRASRKWHHRTSEEYVREFEERLMYVEEKLGRKIERIEYVFPVPDEEKQDQKKSQESEEGEVFNDEPAF